MDERRKAAFDYINDYQKKNYDRITILRSPGEKEKLKQVAALRGLTTTQFVNQAIDRELKRLKIEL